ncbi:MAG TPA: histidine kinase, partial [Puia sp.]|nr:histidine kinase [Puia sp.]
GEDHSGHIWLSFGGHNHIQRYDRTTRQFIELSNERFPLLRITHCFTMQEDRAGNMWFAGDGFCRWNAAKETIDTLVPYPRGLPKLRNYVAVFDCDSNANLWLYSPDNGILRFNYSTGQMRLEEPENELTDGQVLINTGIIRDTIWLAVENGIVAFNTRDRSVRIFPFGESVPNFPLTSLAKTLAYDSPAHCFYLASRRYLMTFRPALQTARDKHAQLFIDDISTAGISVPVEDGRADLYFPDNSVTIGFNAIDFSNPEGNRFAYRVTPSADTSWRLLSEQRSVTFSNLGAGVYRVRIKFFSANNRWAEQYKDLLLVVHPPFWKSRWFIVLVALVLLLAAGLLYRYRMARVREKLSLDKQVAEFEMKALHAQMNPHFIFNALNSIREMILLEDNRNASRYLSRFARLIRLNLEHSRQTFITLRQNNEYLESYLEMEQLRFPGFSFRIQVSPDLDPGEVRLAPMLIQPFVENAIWHGLLPGGSDKWVHIRFYRDRDRVVCEIEDNGIGIRQSLLNKTTAQQTHRSVGISNIQERIAVLNEKYRIRCSLAISDKTDEPGPGRSGTVITLTFPIHEDQPELSTP